MSCANVSSCPLQIQMFIKDMTEITNDIKRQASAAVPNPQLLAPVTL